MTGVTQRFVFLVAAALAAWNPAALGWATPTVSRYHLDVRIDPERHELSAVARLFVTSTTRGSDRLELLVNQGLDVTAVRDGGIPAKFSWGAPQAEARSFIVELTAPLDAGQPREITVEYRGVVLPPENADPDWMGVLLIRPDEVRMTEQTKWCPELPGRKAPFEATIALPSGLTLVCPGHVTKASDRQGQAVWQVTCDKPVAPALIAGKYITRTAAWGKRTLAVHLFPESAGEAEAILGQARRTVDFFERQFGPYPFDRFSVCQMRVLNGRYSYNYACPGYVVLPTEIVRRAGDVQDEHFPRLLAHEIAHQWWGCSVDCKSGPWRLSESLAEFSAALYLHHREPARSLREFLTDAAEESVLLSALVRSGEEVSDKDYQKCLAYQKGPWLLAMLRDAAGSEAFDNDVRGFYAEHAFRQVDSADFLAGLAHDGAATPGPLVQPWIERPVLPRIAVEPVAAAEDPGSVTLDIVQEGPVFRLPLEIRLTTTAGRTTTRCLLTEPRQRHSTPIRGELLFVEVDPERKLLLETWPSPPSLTPLLAQAEVEHAGLCAAYDEKDWAAVYLHADRLCDEILRPLDGAMDVERRRKSAASMQGVQASPRQSVEWRLRLEKLECLAQQIDRLGLSESDRSEWRSLIRRLDDASDELHDRVRDGRLDELSGPHEEFNQTWDLFCRHTGTRLVSPRD